MRSVAVGAHARIREGDAIAHLDDGRHFFQIDLVHDAVTRRDHVDILERALGPFDEVEAILVAAILDPAVLVERVRVEAAIFDRKRVVDDQLRRHHGVDLGGIAALIGDRVT